MQNKIYVVFFLIFSISYAQNDKKIVKASRAINKISIDGVLDEDFWQNATVAKDFVMFQPGDGTKSEQTKKPKLKLPMMMKPFILVQQCMIRIQKKFQCSLEEETNLELLTFSE